MAENKKYYYLKLKENFFEQETIVILESLKDGILYSNILMKIYLKSLQYNGFLKINEHLSMTSDMIATLTRHEVGTVERAIKVFLELGLVEMTDNGLYMSQIEMMVGHSSTEGERKRAARLRLAALTHNTDICPQNVPALSDKQAPEYREQNLENRTYNKECVSDLSHFHGKYHNVMLSDKELETLQTDFPNDYESMIEHLSEYMASTGKQYHNHLATMERWKKADLQKNATPDGYTYNGSYEEGESL